MKYTTLTLAFLFAFSIVSFGQLKEQLKDKYLIVLDIQDCFFDNKFPTETKTDLINQVNSIIDQADPNKVIYIQSLIRVLSISGKGIKVDTATYINFSPELRMVNQTIFTKTKPNSFTNPELEAFLKSKNANDLVVVGLLAEHCVSATALGGLDFNHKMYIIPDAILGKKNSSKAKAVEKMRKKGVQELAVDL